MLSLQCGRGGQWAGWVLAGLVTGSTFVTTEQQSTQQSTWAGIENTALLGCQSTGWVLDWDLDWLGRRVDVDMDTYWVGRLDIGWQYQLAITLSLSHAALQWLLHRCRCCACLDGGKYSGVLLVFLLLCACSRQIEWQSVQKGKEHRKATQRPRLPQSSRLKIASPRQLCSCVDFTACFTAPANHGAKV